MHSNAYHILAETLQIWRRATTLPGVRIAVLTTCTPLVSLNADGKGWNCIMKRLGGWAIEPFSNICDVH